MKLTGKLGQAFVWGVLVDIIGWYSGLPDFTHLYQHVLTS